MPSQNLSPKWNEELLQCCRILFEYVAGFVYIKAVSGLCAISSLLTSTEHNQMKGVNGSNVKVLLSINVRRVGELNFTNSWLKERDGMRLRINLLCILP
jgi:hypothetical protein